MGVQALPVHAVKMNKAAHRSQKAPRNGEAKPEPSREAAASGVRLIEFIVHLQKLGIRHADSGIMDIDNQIDPVMLPPVFNSDIDAALLRERIPDHFPRAILLVFSFHLIGAGAGPP